MLGLIPVADDIIAPSVSRTAARAEITAICARDLG
jgi:hypothetical protein